MEFVHERLLPLADFIGFFLSPATRGALDITTTQFDNADWGTFLEALAWLSLGVEIGLFPILEGNALLSSRLPTIRQRHPEFIADWGFLFPAHTMYPIVRAMKGEAPFIHDAGSAFEDQAKLNGVFQLTGMMARRFALSDLTRWLAMTLNFLDDQKWRELSRTQVSTEEIVGAFSPAGYSDSYSSSTWLRLWNQPGILPKMKAACLAASMNAIQHMASFVEFYLPQCRPSDISPGDWSLLRIRTMELHSWRLNLSNPRIDSRFREFVKELSNKLADEAISGGFQMDRQQFLSAVDDLIRGWNSLRFGVKTASS